MPGPQGAQGAQGATGAAGATGVVAVGSWTGRSLVTTLNPTAFQFIGPTTTVTTTNAQRITASSSLTVLPTTVGLIYFDICYRPSTGTTLTSPISGYKAVTPTAANARTFMAVSNSFFPGAGTWVVGPCARLNTGTNTLNATTDDWATGWAMVTN